MTTPTLIANPYSHHSRKVFILIKELNLDVHHKALKVLPPGCGGENEQPAFRAINPNTKVPVLQDGDFILWESNAILWYLAETHGPTSLWSTNPRERAEIAKWQLWQVANLSPAIDGLMWQSMKRMLKLGEADPAAVEESRGRFQRWANVLNGCLEGKAFLALGRFTLADIAVSSVLMHLDMTPVTLDPYPNIERWFAALCDRPSWATTAPPPMG